MTEKGCDNCYYSYFDERAYPCSLCIRGVERTDQWQPSRKTKADRKTEPQNDCEGCKHYVYQLGCTHHANCAYEPKDEPQKKCHRDEEYACHLYPNEGACNNCKLWYEDEPQTDEFELFDREALILLIECQRERIAELLAKTEPQTEKFPQKWTDWCKECGKKERCVRAGFMPQCYESEDEPQTEEPSFTATDFGKGTITRYTDEPQTEEPPMDEYYKDHGEFYDCDRYVITNDEGERAYGCIGCQTDCAWK